MMSMHEHTILHWIFNVWIHFCCPLQWHKNQFSLIKLFICSFGSLFISITHTNWARKFTVLAHFLFGFLSLGLLLTIAGIVRSHQDFEETMRFRPKSALEVLEALREFSAVIFSTCDTCHFPLPTASKIVVLWQPGNSCAAPWHADWHFLLVAANATCTKCHRRTRIKWNAPNASVASSRANTNKVCKAHMCLRMTQCSASCSPACPCITWPISGPKHSIGTGLGDDGFLLRAFRAMCTGGVHQASRLVHSVVLSPLIDRELSSSHFSRAHTLSLSLSRSHAFVPDKMYPITLLSKTNYTRANKIEKLSVHLANTHSKCSFPMIVLSGTARPVHSPFDIEPLRMGSVRCFYRWPDSISSACLAFSWYTHTHTHIHSICMTNKVFLNLNKHISIYRISI